MTGEAITGYLLDNFIVKLLETESSMSACLMCWKQFTIMHIAPLVNVYNQSVNICVSVGCSALTELFIVNLSMQSYIPVRFGMPLMSAGYGHNSLTSEFKA